jgi:hypothetical protein
VPWPSGPVFAIVVAGGERKVVAGAGHHGARVTGVGFMGMDVCGRESCRAGSGGPLLGLRRREGNRVRHRVDGEADKGVSVGGRNRGTYQGFQPSNVGTTIYRSPGRYL